MTDTHIAVFPGQGAQFVGMGRHLFERYEYHVQLAEEVLGYSLKSLCLDDRNQQLNNTRFTQPALYVVNILHYLDHIEREPQKPDVLAGHSLGEYCALFAAGAFSFETGLRVVAERGRLMSDCKEGSMAAIVGLPHNTIRQILDDSQCTEVEIANINSPQQLVVSGDRTQLTTLERLIAAHDAQFHWLNVSGAFHSNTMREAAGRFREFLQTCSFYPLQIPVIANVSAHRYTMNNESQLIELLTEQLYRPVQWQKTMESLPLKSVRLTEHGPKPILSRLFEQIRQHNQLKSISFTKFRHSVLRVDGPTGGKLR